MGREASPYSLRTVALLAWLRLARVFQKIEGDSESLYRAHDLNRAQFDLLAHVGAASGITQQELADSLLVTKGNISQLLGRLERRGFISRRQAGRTNCLSLTESGRQKYATVVPLQEARIAAVFSPLSEAEQRELLRLLRKLDHAIAR